MLEWKQRARREKTGTSLSAREKLPEVGSAELKARVDSRLVWNRPSVESLNTHWFYPGSRPVPRAPLRPTPGRVSKYLRASRLSSLGASRAVTPRAL